jgi:hypothetical protein
MWVVHDRMAEIWANTKSRELTKEEMKELKICLDANLNKCRKVAALKNLSFAAAMTGDQDWQFELCSKLEEIYSDFH